MVKSAETGVSIESFCEIQAGEASQLTVFIRFPRVDFRANPDNSGRTNITVNNVGIVQTGNVIEAVAYPARIWARHLGIACRR